MEKQTCPTCGQGFQRLWQHKCPNAVPNPGSTTSHKKSAASTKEKQPCPTCGCEFQRLWQHKCPNAVSDPADGTASHHKSAASTKAKQPCPTCGREFERLWQHKCPAVASSNLADVTSRVHSPANAARVSTKEKQPCPTCGRDFERLWQHKCPAVGSSDDTSWEILQGAADVCSGGDMAGNSAGGSHSGKQVGKAPCSTEQHTGSGYRGARSKVKSAQTSDSCSPPTSADSARGRSVDEQNSKQVCPWCGVAFKRLYQHKCKAVCLPPTPSKPASRRASSRASSRPSTPDHGSTGLRPVIDTSALAEKAQKVMEALQLQPSSDPNSEAIAFFDDEVKLKRDDKSNALDASTAFRRSVIQWLEDSTECLKWNYLNAGSSYDGTKVTRADEVDFMFFPDLPGDWLSITCDHAPPGYCFVETTSAVSRDDPRGRFLDSIRSGRGRLSSQHFREKMVDIFRRAVADKRRAREDPDAKPGGASYAVLLNAFPRSGGDAGLGHRPVSIDLVPALKLDGFPSQAESSLRHVPAQDAESIRKAGFHVIPKECPHDEYRKDRHLLWRLSFSLAEKQLTKYADRRQHSGTDPEQKSELTAPTCRKTVLRTLKRFLEIIKGVENSRTSNPKMLQLRKAVRYLKEKGGFGHLKIEKFSTFQIRTLLWTEFYVTYPGAEYWTTRSRRTRVIHCLNQLKKMVSGRMRVPHFFLPSLDIMAEVPQREREFLYIMFHVAKELF